MNQGRERHECAHVLLLNEPYAGDMADVLMHFVPPPRFYSKFGNGPLSLSLSKFGSVSSRLTSASSFAVVPHSPKAIGLHPLHHHRIHQRSSCHWSLP